MITRKQIESISKELLDEYMEMETELVELVASQFDQLEEVAQEDAQEWFDSKILQSAMVGKAARKIVQKRSGAISSKVASVVEMSVNKTLAVDEAVYRMAFKRGILKNAPVPMAESYKLKHIINQTSQSIGRTLNLTGTTAVQSTNKAFLRALNDSYIGVSSGATTHHKAIKQAVQSMARHGIDGATYVGINKNGKPYVINMPLDVVVRQTTITSTGQAAARAQEARAEEWGSNLVETTSHAACRPTHEPWQGRIFSLRGETDEYPNLAEATGYGEVDGLCGANCGHNFYPYIEGISTRTYYPTEDPALNAQQYEESKKQRALERKIRAAKREDAANIASGGDATGKVQESQKEMRAFIAETGRTRRNDREQIYD